jgi:ADP-heptose:LPS heptosyltransferase
VQLAALLAGQGARVLFSIGPDDHDVQDVLDREPSGIRRLPRFSGSIPALAAILRRASVVAASSTGPVHLAAALGVPTLAFHVPWRSCGVERWGPYADNGWALVADTAGAARWGRGRRERLGPRLLDALSPGLASRCIERMLEGDAPEVAAADGP